MHSIRATDWELKKKNPVTCNNLDEPREYDAKWNKPVTEAHILPDSPYMKYNI